MYLSRLLLFCTCHGWARGKVVYLLVCCQKTTGETIPKDLQLALSLPLVFPVHAVSTSTGFNLQHVTCYCCLSLNSNIFEVF